MQTIQRRISLNTLDISLIEQRLWSLLYGRGLFSFVRLYGANIERQSMRYYDTTTKAWLYIGLLLLPIKITSVQLNDCLCHCESARRAQEITFVNDFFVFRINYLCQQLKVLQLCHTLFPLGVIRYSYGGMSIYTLVWDPILYGV